ncbi:hypothetical protein MTR62_14530, partial [Novosphingobium sp. 1949]|nr:hypothetical protein [Novosphingobium organovorum]
AASSSASSSAPRRWSADAWALIRSGTGGVLGSGAYPATYGASQSGAIVRYRIAPRSAYLPTAYLRSTSTLGGASQATAAMGLSLRPIATLPIVAAAEGRLTSGTGGNRVQPVALAVSELPPIELGRGLRLEAYGQGGYVAGKYATAFADGQARVDREVASLGQVRARLGAGVWGGAQKGVARFDAGPSAAVTMPLGKQRYGRLGLDWRFRVAGDAEPGSGPAVTLSAGF